ncbi:MAG: aminodeoxychorismate synthase component I [Chloroflexota bacterium]|nr:aminodeoxychorismate synthase component I [Chloroflexota bacterium]
MTPGLVVLQDAQGTRWLRFSDPVAVFSATSLEEVGPSLNAIDHAVTHHGLHAAGYIAYEAAPAFDRALTVHASVIPLLWFGLYKPPEVLWEIPGSSSSSYDLGDWQPAVTEDAYGQAISAIKQAIAAGLTYQVNYTFPMHASFGGDPWGLFVKLSRAQKARYAAFLDTGDLAICSASPELFFQLDGTTLLSKPMKGTASRGRWPAEDQGRRQWLRHSSKNQAENVMIVDMIRNDMGRVADIGTVHVPRLFEVEGYPTVWQMTSTVISRTRVPVPDILNALFPCASITGAPKVRTMKIIAGLEPHPRGVYTGAIGYIAPGRRAQFNVAIRTVLIDRRLGLATYGVGGGIVWDSSTDDEYQEAQLKARVLTETSPSFDLLETILWTPADGYFLLDQHLDRLAQSAAYFAIDVDLRDIERRLAKKAVGLGKGTRRVRLLVSQDGEVGIEAWPLDPTPEKEPLRIGLARWSVDSNDRFLYHKTTHRSVYEQARASRPNCDEVLLWNERREITEASMANVVLDLDGELVTPPVSSGLLAGVYRGRLLEQGKIRTRVLCLDDLKRCEKLFLVNSVRQWREGVLSRSDH